MTVVTVVTVVTAVTVVTVVTVVTKNKLKKKKNLFTKKNHANIARIMKSCPESWSVGTGVEVITKIIQDSKTQIVKKKLKTQIVTKLKNSNCDKPQKLKL